MIDLFCCCFVSCLHVNYFFPLAAILERSCLPLHLLTLLPPLKSSTPRSFSTAVGSAHCPAQFPFVMQLRSNLARSNFKGFPSHHRLPSRCLKLPFHSDCNLLINHLLLFSYHQQFLLFLAQFRPRLGGLNHLLGRKCHVFDHVRVSFVNWS